MGWGLGSGFGGGLVGCWVLVLVEGVSEGSGYGREGLQVPRICVSENPFCNRRSRIDISE